MKATTVSTLVQLFGEVYVVRDVITKYPDGTVHAAGKECDCEGWKYRGTCKHVKMLKHQHVGSGAKPDVLREVQARVGATLGIGAFSEEMEKDVVKVDYAHGWHRDFGVVEHRGCVFYFPLEPA